MASALRHGSRQVPLALCVVALLAAGCRKKPTEAHLRLDNGLRVDLYASSKGDHAALALLFDIGADQDPPGRSGMAHLVERLFATGGRPGKPARNADQMKAQYAGGFKGETGADDTLYAVEVPAGQLLDELDDAALRMASLMLTDADLDRERARLLADLAATQEHDPISVAMLRAAESVRPTRGNGLRGGVPGEIEAMSLDEESTASKGSYGGATARLVVAGHFDVADATKRIQASFGKAPGAKAAPARAPSGASVKGTLVMGSVPSAVALAVPVPDPKDPIYPAFLVLAARLLDASGAGHTWRADFAPLARPDILFVTSPIPVGQAPEPFAAQLRAEVNKIVGAAPGGDDIEHATDRFGSTLGMTPVRSDMLTSAPIETAFEIARRAQLGIDGVALAQAAQAIKPEQLAAAAKLFDNQSSAAVIAGGI